MKRSENQNSSSSSESDSASSEPMFSHVLGHSRYVVLLAVGAVLLVAVSLFLQATILAVMDVWKAWSSVARGTAAVNTLSITFLELVHLMLEAVVFYLIAVGFYSLFIAPLNLAVALGVETLSDLEEKLISTVVAIMAVTFLEHFIAWKNPMETLQFGAAMALVTASLVAFQSATARARQNQKENSPNTQARAQKELFDKGNVQHEIKPDEIEPQNDKPDDESKSGS